MSSGSALQSPQDVESSVRAAPHLLHLVCLCASGPPAPTRQRQRPAPFCSPNPTTGAGDRDGRGWRKAPFKGQVGAELRAGKRAVLGGGGLEALHASAPYHQASHKPTASGQPLSPRRRQAQPPRAGPILRWFDHDYSVSFKIRFSSFCTVDVGLREACESQPPGSPPPSSFPTTSFPVWHFFPQQNRPFPVF